jgi:CPA2 family monovalent cation:H+ antiporter-2
LNIFFIAPFLSELVHGFWAKILCTVIPLVAMSPFIIGLLRQNIRGHILLVRKRANHFPMFVFLIIRLTTAVFLVMYTINQFMGISMSWLVLPALLIIIVLPRFDAIFGRFLQIETHFLTNFNEKQLTEWALNEEGDSMDNLLGNELWVGQYRFEKNFNQEEDLETMTDDKMKKRILRHNKIMGKAQNRFKRFRKHAHDSKLSDVIAMMVERFFNIKVIEIKSGKKQINLPENSSINRQKLHVGDTLFLLGTKERLAAFNDTDSFRSFMVEEALPVTLRNFIENQEQEEKPLLCFAIIVNKKSGLIGKSIKDSGIHKKWNCIVIGLQRDIYPIVLPDTQTFMNNGDKIWVLGSQKPTFV